MSVELYVAIIAAAASVAGVVITTRSGIRQTQAQLEKAQAVTEEKLKALTDEVRRHNDFARKIPAIEARVSILEGGRAS